MFQKFFFLAAFLFSLATSHSQQTKKALLVIVDGIPSDVIESMELPNLQKIKTAGGYSRSYVGGVAGTYSETPTISAVGYNSILTGVWANKHNVWGNEIKSPNYHYPTIFRLLKDQYPDKKTAIFSTWLDNRTKLVGDRLEATGNHAVDYKYDSLELDEKRFPHDPDNHYLDIIDDSVAVHASKMIREVAPDFSWVYLEYPDDMGHAFGDSPPFQKAVRDADERVGRLWDAVQYRQKNFQEDWLIIITTDHGRDSVSGKNHGGQSDRERASWIFTNAKDLNQQFNSPQTSAVDIMPTFARFLDIRIPEATGREFDGQPFIGPLSFTDVDFRVEDKQLHITWNPEEGAISEDLKIYCSNTNNRKSGGDDRYRLIKTVPAKNGRAQISLSGYHYPFLKVVLEGKHSRANHWITEAPLMEGRNE